MGCCSIRWCGKNSKNSNFKADGITFHRFPRDPHLKGKWINCTKRENWFPSSYSVVCSRHFTEDCFYIIKHRRRLLDTAIPTLHLPIVSNAVTSECAPGNLSPTSSSQQEPTPEGKVGAPDETPSQCYALTNKRLCRRVLELSSKVKNKNKTIKVLQDKLRYFKNKVASLTVIIKEFEKKSLEPEVCLVEEDPPIRRRDST